MKGLVAIEELPGQPAVIHGVRHVFAQPVFLDRWPERGYQDKGDFHQPGHVALFSSQIA